MQEADPERRRRAQEPGAGSPGHTPPSSHYLGSGVYQQASLQMVTNTRVAVGENFARRFRRYLKHKYQLDGSEAWATLRSILGELYDGADPVVLDYRGQMPGKLTWWDSHTTAFGGMQCSRVAKRACNSSTSTITSRYGKMSTRSQRAQILSEYNTELLPGAIAFWGGPSCRPVLN